PGPHRDLHSFPTRRSSDLNAVALSGDGNTLAVGAIGEASSTTGIDSTPNELAPGAGAVYVYTRNAGTWSQQAYVKASTPGPLVRSEEHTSELQSRGHLVCR